MVESTIEELKRRHGRGQGLLVEVDDPERLSRALVGLDWVRQVERHGATLRVSVNNMATAERVLPAVLANTRLALRRLEAEEVSLEEVFVELVGQGRP